MNFNLIKIRGAESQNKVIRLYEFRKTIFSTKVEVGVKHPLQLMCEVLPTQIDIEPIYSIGHYLLS